MTTTPRPDRGTVRRPPDQRLPDDLMATLAARCEQGVPLEAYRSLAQHSGVPLSTVLRYAVDGRLGDLAAPYSGHY